MGYRSRRRKVMQRELKFRALDRNDGKVKKVGQIDFLVELVQFIGESGWVDFNNVELMQYTGLKDKNGKEIYEGDVIPYHFNKKTVSTVKYGEYHNPFDSDNHGGHVGFYLEWNEENSLLRVDLGYWIKVSEVIGNIYENPELLTQSPNDADTHQMPTE
jgi:uncharacterized phage protein (TIGR01671 family)